MSRTKQRTEVVDLDRAERANTSPMGNPSFWVYDTRGRRWRTATDTSCAYAVQNWWSRGVDRRGVTLVIEGRADGGRGRIVDIYRDEPERDRRYRA